MAASCKLIILGPPGAGKGTQARLIAHRLGILHIDCGQVIRGEVSGETEFGKQAKEHMLAGRLVPDELIINMMLKRLSEPGGPDGFLLDGFPRTVIQAEGLDKYLAGKGDGLDYIIYLGISEETVVGRLTSRRYCPACGAVFNILTAPPKVEGICDACGGELKQRPDDLPETVIERLKVYDEETSPLRDYYRKSDGYLEFDGDKAGEEVTDKIIDAITAGGGCD